MRIDSGLRDALVREAGSEGRSMANMLERLLSERYAAVAPMRSDGNRAVPEVLVEKGFPPAPTLPSERPSRNGLTTTAVRAHMKRTRPAVECPSRVFVDGVCVECGADEAGVTEETA